MSGRTQIFFTGATGYVGGAILQKLATHPTAANSEFTLLVRSPEKARLLEDWGKTTPAGGVKILLGSLTDYDKVTAQVAKSDVVFSMADSYNDDPCKAILAGLKERFQNSGKVPILIHTSGTGTLKDDAQGKFEGETIYDDITPDQIESLPDGVFHRNVDLLVLAADREGYAKTYIVFPPTIYGLPVGPLFDKNISNRHSHQIPFLIRAGVARKQGGVVNDGLNKWPCVHYDDCAEFYITLYTAILEDKADHGRGGNYFIENGEYRAYDLAKAITEELAEVGQSDKSTPVPFTAEEYEKTPMLSYFGTNSRCKASKARALGWKPKHPAEDIFASIRPEVRALLNIQP
ncbi:NAD(P)-binding protein [Coniophora puteana RWD-64-598 SS2]|uniref:NAD(P)-binding protein n=1 Tax=Coniophora puteana (strain RWD-64-598) TaxID=741705 RepID=A0A5M3MY26_CONPW|nr:NAD(P)-binding protein [Coniophora puteana RWD-64-598 SS2]EIW84038.1 NAD(P)-binding protein [Coniophora puteana RWD-64-598 SS2]